MVVFLAQFAAGLSANKEVHMQSFQDYNEKVDWFNKRTNKHIKLVQDFARKLEDNFPEELSCLVVQSLVHDESKFKEPEYTPYLDISWNYKLKDEGKPSNLSTDAANKATFHHVKNNKHHPEYHTTQTDNILNRDDRDKPSTVMVDSTKMDIISLAEMVCDWSAMSVEKKTDPYKWAEMNINKRWKFTDEQVKKIYEYLDFCKKFI